MPKDTAANNHLIYKCIFSNLVFIQLVILHDDEVWNWSINSKEIKNLVTYEFQQSLQWEMGQQLMSGS